MSDHEGELFTVVVAGPGTLRWGVEVRAADEPGAKERVEGRGHRVLEVRRGPTPGAAATRLVLGVCIRCGYSLLRLPAGAGGEVMCPEYGVIHGPTAPLEVRREKLGHRARHVRILTYLLLALLGTLVLVAATV
jgi:hypothetical protein